MFELIFQHWVLLGIVLAGIGLLWFAAILSKYVRLMLNIFRDSQVPLLMGPLDYIRIEGHPVQFRAFDGTRLQGMFLSASMLPRHLRGHNHPAGVPKRKEERSYLNEKTRGVVIFCHEYSSDMYSCTRYCLPLLQAGFDVFAFDFRAQGGSSDCPGYKPRIWCTDKEVLDCLGALAYVQNLLEEFHLDVKIGIFGISRGGCAAILTALHAYSAGFIKAVVTDGVFSSDSVLEMLMQRWASIFARVRFVYEKHGPLFWSFLRWLVLFFASIRFHCRFPSVRKSLTKQRRLPMFFIHGQCDSYVPAAHAWDLYQRTSPPKYLWMVRAARHNQSAIISSGRYGARITAFMEKYLTNTPLESCNVDKAYLADICRFFASEEAFDNPSTGQEGDKVSDVEAIHKVPTAGKDDRQVHRSLHQ